MMSFGKNLKSADSSSSLKKPSLGRGGGQIEGGSSEVHNKYITRRSYSNSTQSVNFNAIGEELSEISRFVQNAFANTVCSLFSSNFKGITEQII